MDFSFGDLIPTEAANKASTKAKPKPKPKPKPRPKTQPEPKSTPTPPVEAAVTADNEIIGRTEEEQPPFDVNQISSNINADWPSSFEKPHEENGDSYLTLESLNDFLPQSTSLTDTPTIDVSMDGNIEKEPIQHDLTTSVDACTNLESPAHIDPLTGEEASIFNDNESFQIESLSEDAESSLFWEPLDILSESRTCAGPKVGKFKPKPNAQTRKVENIHSLSSQIDYTDNAPLPSFTPDELLGTSSIGITDSIPAEAVPDFHVNEEPPTFAEMPQVDSVIPSEHPDSIPETPSVGHETVRKGKRQSSEPSPESEASRSSERLRKQSKKTLSLIDEDDFENEGIGDEIIHGNENNDNIDDYRPENESVSEKKGRKSKKAVNDKEKPVRKRKKASEVPSESTKVKKKFPHSTRRNKRPVDPELLKIPYDDLDTHIHTIPMKELIRLVEYKEKEEAKKNPPAPTSGKPASNRSGGSYFNDFDEEAAFGEERGSGDENDNLVEVENTTYYNYRTHMKITPRMKWSKQDTELFYEAIQQFGTDLSMIKECFPGRTREQIKSKYKKEEKQQPLRLNDALTTRFKGNAHFEVVIERLKQAQGEDFENEENEDDVATDNNNEGKCVDSEKKDKEEKEGDAPQVGSPTKSHDSDDETYLWSQYKSDI